MRGKTSEHMHAAHERHHRAKGGGVSEHEKIPVVSGNPTVLREAEEHKRGGKVKRKHKRAHGGKIEGKHMRHRMDRPGRKRGGAVGADHKPLSSAHHSTEASPGEPKNEEGGLSAFRRGGSVHHHEHEHHEKHEHHHRKRGGAAAYKRGGHVDGPGAHHRER